RDADIHSFPTRRSSDLLSGEIRRAENITGRNFTDDEASDYEEMDSDIFNAVLNGVATRFDSRQDNAEGSDSETVNASIFTYRQQDRKSTRLNSSHVKIS